MNQQQNKFVKTNFTTSEDICTDSNHGGYMGFHKKNCPHCTPFTEEDYNDSSLDSFSFESKTFGQNKLDDE